MSDNTFKKAAVLTGLTILVGGAEISNAGAGGTTPQADTFSISAAFFHPLGRKY